MRGSRIAVRAALVCSAAGIVCVLWAATDDTPAHAADAGPLSPVVDVAAPVVDLADTAEHAIEEPARRVTELAAPASKPLQHTQVRLDRVRAAAVDTVRQMTRAAPPPAPEPAPEIRAATPPPADPAPAAPEVVPAVVLLAGTAPTTVTVDPLQAHTSGPAAAYALLCGEASDLPPSHPGLLAVPNGTPCTPDDRDATGLATVKPPTKTGADQLAATTPTGPATLALRLLGELLPRSDLPTGRAEHPEPGPA